MIHYPREWQHRNRNTSLVVLFALIEISSVCLYNYSNQTPFYLCLCIAMNQFATKVTVVRHDMNHASQQ